MNQKLIIILMFFCLIFLVGCNQNDNQNKNEYIETTYQEEDLNNILLTISDYDLTLDLSNDNHFKQLLLNIKLSKYDSSDDKLNRNTKYIVYFSDYEFTIYDNNTICYIDSSCEYDNLLSSNNDFSYLDSLYNKEILNFEKYHNEQKIMVLNSKNNSLEIEDKNNFLVNLQKVKFLKLNHKSIFTLGDMIYQIKIDDEIINIYSQFFTINDNLYVITQGDFNFLNQLKFNSSSGWLPWI